MTAPGTAPQEDVFPQIVRQASETVTVDERGFELSVHFAAPQRPYVEAAVEALQRPVRYLEQATGLTPQGKIEAYLYPWSPEEDPPHYQPHGQADFTLVLLVVEGKPLLGPVPNQHWYLETLPHELVHSFVRTLPIEDRWLEDGLAEYLKREFVTMVRREIPELQPGPATLPDLYPAVEALRRVEWTAWDHRPFRRLMKHRQNDPAQAVYLGQQEIWRYSAAAELLTRWMTAAARAGIAEPVRDLIQRLQAHDGRIEWKDTRDLIRAQTGRSLEDLVEVTEEEVEAVRRGSWAERHSQEFSTRIRALMTLTYVGAPPGVAAASLLTSFDLPEKSPTDSRAVEALAVAAAGAVAASGDVETAVQAGELLVERFGPNAHWYSHPALWGLVAQRNRQVAMAQLAATVKDPRSGLEHAEIANELLEKLTGETVGWAVELTPAARQQAAARWAEVVAALG